MKQFKKLKNRLYEPVKNNWLVNKLMENKGKLIASGVTGAATGGVTKVTSHAILFSPYGEIVFQNYIGKIPFVGERINDYLTDKFMEIWNVETDKYFKLILETHPNLTPTLKMYARLLAARESYEWSRFIMTDIESTWLGIGMGMAVAVAMYAGIHYGKKALLSYVQKQNERTGKEEI